MRTNWVKAQKTALIGMIIPIILIVQLACNIPQRISTPTIEATDPANGSTGVSLLTSTSVPYVSMTQTPEWTPPTEFVHITSTPLPPTPTAPIDRPAHYNLDAVLDYTLHTLKVKQTIAYTNLSSDTLNNLILIIEPNLISGGFNLASITWDDGQDVERFELNGNQMHIPLPQPLQPGGALGLGIDYSLVLPQIDDTSTLGRPVAYGYSDLQTNLVDWYPYVPPYMDGQGWLVHPPWDLGEYQVYDVSDFNVTLSLAVPNPQLVVAASAPAMPDGNQYSYRLEAARSFALSASLEYIVQSTTVGGVTVSSYSFPAHQSAGQEVLRNTVDAMQLFSRLLLPYPRALLSIVEADFLDGMEYDGLFFLSHGFYELYDGTPGGYLTFLAAHETAHQWWYGLVGNDQAMEPWLDEALSTYMELVFYQHTYTDYRPLLSSSLESWWWYYRVNFYDPSGWVDGSIYDFTESRAYRNAIYLNGAIFLDELRSLVGDQAFFDALKEYAYKNAYRIATAQDFFGTLRSHTKLDLEELITTYFQASR